jgi:hypothetical protein
MPRANITSALLWAAPLSVAPGADDAAGVFDGGEVSVAVFEQALTTTAVAATAANQV